MLLLLIGFLPLTFLFAEAPTNEDTRNFLARLTKEADRFERNAHRFMGVETLRQTQPQGTRFSTGPRGTITQLPEAVHEIVSEYGWVSADEPGGSLKEVRLVLTVDGLKWKQGKKDLNALAGRIGTRDGKNRGKTLESYEDYGLRGFLSDSGQIILLFARNGVERYEFQFDRSENAGVLGNVNIYRYQQIDGGQALTIYGGKEPIRQKMKGEVWVRASDMLPLRVTLESNHSLDGNEIHDVTAVSYEMSRWGMLLPSHIDHRQYVDKRIFVVDEFSYDKFKEVISGRMR